MTETLTTGSGDAQAVIDVARQAAEPTVLDTGEVYAFATADQVEVVDGRSFYVGHPARKEGTFVAYDAESFAAYVLEQADGKATKVWVDEHRLTARAVLNGHADELAGFGDHLLQLELEPTESWRAWAAMDGRLVGQTEFAELIEDNAADVVTPTAADMLEIAQSFQATTKVTFESSKYLADGRRALEYKEDTAAKAGHRGALEIPAEFHLALRPFFGAEVYRVVARFRYRISDGHLRIGYKLTRPADVQRAAFSDIIDDVKLRLGDAGVTVLSGRPR